MLQKYNWPGNVRELRYSIERAVILCDGDRLRARDFASLDINNGMTQEHDGHTLTLEEIEQNTIRQVLKKHQGNISKAARELGLTRTSLYRRIGKYEL